MHHQPGQLLGGKYRLIRQLGSGGMGSVWHAQHLVLNAPVALKFIGAERLDTESVQRFLGEARMAAALRSPHVVQILDFGVEGGTPHIAMELLQGETLADRLARVGALDLRQTARVLQHVVRAIARAHDAGIVHRDLKPENVFIVENEDDELIKVLDFGIAKATPAVLGKSIARATRTGELIGTPQYMSPEQLEGEFPVDHRTDIWSLGVLAYECLLGQLPFGGDTVARVVLAVCSKPMPVPSRVGPVPDGFDAWFAQTCARDPRARFSSARAAAAAFASLVPSTDAAADPAWRAPAGGARRERGAVGTGPQRRLALVDEEESPPSTRREDEAAPTSRRRAEPRRGFTRWIAGLAVAAGLAFAAKAGVEHLARAGLAHRAGVAPQTDERALLPEPSEEHARTSGRAAPEDVHGTSASELLSQPAADPSGLRAEDTPALGASDARASGAAPGAEPARTSDLARGAPLRAVSQRPERVGSAPRPARVPSGVVEGPPRPEPVRPGQAASTPLPQLSGLLDLSQLQSLPELQGAGGLEGLQDLQNIPELRNLRELPDLKELNIRRR